MFNPTAPVNEQLALYSDLFMLIAALVYAAAFILFTIDMATASATIRRLEADLAARLAERVDELDGTISRIRSSIFELQHHGHGESLRADLRRLVQADGAGAEADGEAMAALMRAHGGDVTVTVDPAEGEALMALRRTAFPALERLGTPLVEDVAVPRSRMAEMFARIREIEARTGVAIPTTAHAGDGNLHPILLFGAAAQVGGAAEDAASIPADVWEAAGELFRAGLELGGTLTGEHGVGLLKRAFLRDELGDAQHDLQQRIKAVFDPHGILNPGKVFTP